MGQHHLLDTWDQLTPPQQALLASQLALCTPALLEQQRHIHTSTPPSLEPWTDVHYPASSPLGHEAISQGRVGCLLLAGGHGSRLRCPSAKGLVTIHGKSLFQIFAEATPPTGRLAIMLCPAHYGEVSAFFTRHNRFGLRPDQLSLFVQSELPLLDRNHNWFLETPSRLATGPDGNGSALHHFYQSGIWHHWQANNVDLVRILPIDNPLADPFDPRIISHHLHHNLEVSLEAIARTDPSERVGVLTRHHNTPRILEYSELPPENAHLPWANLSAFCMTLSFIKHIALSNPLPLHRAYKTHTSLSQPIDCIKSERFIFDALEQATRIGVLATDRSKFVPLKNPSDLPKVAAALLKRSH
jgi:UDP-N-acetylglucosamine/UDP-N-acetylgalactosamine diphosphorylase